MSNNEPHFPGTLKSRPILLSDLGIDNRSIQAIYTFRQSVDDTEIKNDLDNVLRLACDALCAACADLGIDPDVLDYWDGLSECIVTPFDPSI